MKQYNYWHALDMLVQSSRVVIDRPKGSAHPHYPTFHYPLDYGYLQGTRSSDGSGIDVWVGSLPQKTVTGIIIAVDRAKRDAETKILLGCTREEMETVLKSHQVGQQAAMLVRR
jgi:inorganic pyrophosphatase